MFKERLLTPGPTHIPDEVIKAMQVPMLHHRSDVFKRHLRDACDGVRWALSWPSDPVFLAASGTGALEACLLNCCSTGDEIIYVNSGTFGARWGLIAERLGVVAHEVTVEWGSAVTLEAVQAVCRSYPRSKAICFQHSETSTTVLHPLEDILPTLRDEFPNLLTIVDGISASVTTAVPGTAATIDMYVAGSQKGYMLPPGLSWVMLSDRAWKVVENTKKHSLYFDFLFERKAIAAGETKWTPASLHIVGLNAAIGLLRKEGLEKVYSRHRMLSTIARAGVISLGCTLLAPKNPCPSVTGFMLPNSISTDADVIRTEVRKQFGIRLAGGQEKWKGKIIRIGHMGFVDPFDVVNAITAIGMTLTRLGHPVEVSATFAKMIGELESHAE